MTATLRPFERFATLAALEAHLATLGATSDTARTAFDSRHGGPFDRGSADAWYGRPFNPHYYVGATYNSERVAAERMTEDELIAYEVGFKTETGRKDWGDSW